MRWIAAACLVIAAAAPDASAQTMARSFAECDAMLLESPHHPFAYRCYWSAARGGQNWDDGRLYLERILGQRPDNHRARLSLALIEADQSRVIRSIDQFRQAIAGFELASDPQGEVYGWHSLAYVLTLAGRRVEAAEALRAGDAVATRSGDPMLRAAIHVEQGLVAEREGDYGLAWERYRTALELLVPAHPLFFYLNGRALTGLAEVARATARYRVAFEAFRQQAETLHEMGGHFAEVEYRLSSALMGERLWREGGMARDTLQGLVSDVLAYADRHRHTRAHAEARLLQAAFLEADHGRRALERVLDEAIRDDLRSLASQACRRLSQHLRMNDRAAGPEVERFAGCAVRFAREMGDPAGLALALVEQAEVEWQRAPGSDAGLAAWQVALDGIERVRNLQPDDMVRARFFADWSFAYYRLASHLLAPATLHERRARALAFDVSERRRSRVLLDRLDSAGTSAPDRAGEIATRRAGVLARIADVQRFLLDPALPPQVRRDELRRLEDLEAEERVLRERLAREDGAYTALDSPSFPSLQAVQAQLGDDEVLLSYNLPGTRGPDGSLPDVWLMAITPERTAVHRLPAHKEIADATDLLLALIERRDGSERHGARRLYALLLKEALEALPDSVRRLVIVPDGNLHRLPFSALIPGSDDTPLAARLEVVLVPSVTAWSVWRSRAQPPRGLALVFADPAPPQPQAHAPSDRGRTWASASALGPLPHARREGRIIAGELRHGTALRVGSQASEHFLKRTDLGPYSILHFATHAVVSEVNPRRSAVLLAPGAGDEDGLLQPHEIVELELAGKLVAIFGCRSATGELLNSEGVLGLGDAFFKAGAHAVVGSLWPLRDTEAAEMSATFYRGLRRSGSAAAALRHAQIELIGRGAPVAAWAGLVVLGDGSLQPFEGHPDPAWGMWVVAVVAVALLAAAGLCARRAARRHARSPLVTLQR